MAFVSILTGCGRIGFASLETPVALDGGVDVPAPLYATAGFDDAAAVADPASCLRGTNAASRRVYVDASAPLGGDGEVDAPFRTIDAAFEAIGAGEDTTVCIAAGVYVEHIGVTGTHDVFADGRGYHLHGGYVDGFARRDAIVSRTHVVAPSADAAVIRFGNVRRFTLDGLELSGGRHGVLVEGYDPARVVRIANCHVHDNGVRGLVDLEGAGLMLTGADIVVASSVVERNIGSAFGAGISIGMPAGVERNTWDELSGLTVTRALARIERTIVRENRLEGPSAQGAGLSFFANFVIDASIVERNVGVAVAGEESLGGGVAVLSPHVTGEVRDTLISANVARQRAGGLLIDEGAVVTLVNVVVDGNVGPEQIAVDGAGNGTLEAERAYLTLLHSTVAGGTADGLSVRDARVRITNSLFTENRDRDLVVDDATGIAEDATIDASLVLSITDPDARVTHVGTRLMCTPSYVAAPYRLAAASDCATSGLGVVVPALDYPGAQQALPAWDAAGQPRRSPSAIGAFEGL